MENPFEWMGDEVIKGIAKSILDGYVARGRMSVADEQVCEEAALDIAKAVLTDAMAKGSK